MDSLSALQFDYLLALHYDLMNYAFFEALNELDPLVAFLCFFRIKQ